MITNIDKFSNLRFITSSIDPGQLTGKVLKDAQNSIIINTYSGHIGIFVCDGEGNIQRATAEFSNDFNIDGNVASISGAVNELKQQIKDLRDAFNSLSKNGGSVHVPLVTNPPLPKPISVALSQSNVTISDNNVVEVIITTTYDKNFRFPSDIIEPSISTGGTGIMHDVSPYSKQNNVCKHKLRLSKNSNVERNNTIIVSVGNVQATLGVTVTKPNDVYAKITKIRTSVDNIVFNNDNTTATITVQKELSEGIKDDKRLKTQIIQSDGITVDIVEYTATADTYYISPSGGNGSIKFGVKDENFNSGVNNITVGVVDKRTVVSPSPSVTPTVPSAPKSLRRISKVTVNNGEPVSIKAGTIKTVKYTVEYVGEQEDAITNNIDIRSKDDITVEVDNKTKTITFTTPRTLGTKNVDFDITSNKKVVGTVNVNVTALAIQRISKVTLLEDNNATNSVQFKAGTIKTVKYTVDYVGELPDNDTNNIEIIASKDGIDATLDATNKTISFHTERTLGNKNVDFDITSNKKVVGTIHVNVTALLIRRITNVTVNTTNSVQFKAGTDTTVDYTVTYNGSAEDTITDGNTDNIEIASTPDILVGINTGVKKIMFSTQNNMGAKHVDFTVTSNGEIVGTVNVDVTAQEPQRISEVRVNDNKPVNITAGTDKKVSYDIIAYRGELPDNNTDNIEIVSQDSNITANVDKTNKTITFTTPRTSSNQSHTFNVTCNGNKVGTVKVNVTALPLRRITEVIVNGNRPVSLAAGDGTTVDYTVTYNGNEKETITDANTNNIEIVSKDNINVVLDPGRKKITFRLAYDVITPKSVNFDVISNSERVGTITVNVRYNIVLKNGLGENPMILVQNRSVALSDLATITGTHGTLKYKSSVFALEDADGYLRFTENENKQGTVTLYVDEDKTVEKSFTVKMYKVSDVEIYAAGKDLTSGVLQHELPLQLDTRFTDSGVTFFNDTDTFRKEVTWSVENAPSNPNFVATITNTGLFSTNSPSRYNITAIVTYKANGREVYRESTFKQITVSKNELMRPRFISLDPERIEITAGTPKDIRYTITSHKGSDNDGKEDTITVKPKNSQDNQSVDITVMSGDNKIRITPKVTTVDRTVILGIYDADNNEVRNFDVKIKGVQKHGLLLKEGVVTPIVLFNGNTIYPDNLVTITNPYNKDNEKLVVTAPDFSIDTYYRPTIHEDVTRSGTIKIHFSDDVNTHIDIPAQQYKLPWVTINEGDQTMFRNEKKQFTVTYHIDSDNIDARTRDEFRYEIEWSVRKEFNKPIIGTINQNTGEFIPQADGECTIEAKVKHFKLNNLIYIQTITRQVTVKASDNANYVLRTTQPVNKVEINQFNITNKIGVSADVILTSTRNGNYEVPNVEVITNNGAPKATINYYLTRVEGTNNCKLTIASATHSTTNGQNLKGATGIVKLTVGKGSRNEQNVEIPFVKNYDSPIERITTSSNKVVIRNTEQFATISGQIHYKGTKPDAIWERTDNGLEQTHDLAAIDVQLYKWSNLDTNRRYDDWTIEKTIDNSYDMFTIKATRKFYDHAEDGYESKVRIYSKVDPSCYTDVHLVYLNDNGDNSLIETGTPSPTPSPSPSPVPQP
nr:MAG TPA: hypothetical protein [Caudoviricetes sp.]